MTLIDRNGSFALYSHTVGDITQSNELIHEFSVLVATGFEQIHLHRALRITADEYYPWVYDAFQQASTKKSSFVYFVRYEPPIDTTDRILRWSDRNYYPYTNKIIAVSLAYDQLDPCEDGDLSLEKSKAYDELYKVAVKKYFEYIRNNVKSEKELEQILTQPNQILYGSLCVVANEFFGTGLSNWMFSRSIEHIQSCHHFKRVYIISYSDGVTRVAKEFDGLCIETILCNTFEYPEGSGNYPFGNMLDTDVISIFEKIYE